jgi:hypothetical protein
VYATMSAARTRGWWAAIAVDNYGWRRRAVSAAASLAASRFTWPIAFTGLASFTSFAIERCERVGVVSCTVLSRGDGGSRGKHAEDEVGDRVSIGARAPEKIGHPHRSVGGVQRCSVRGG